MAMNDGRPEYMWKNYNRAEKSPFRFDHSQLEPGNIPGKVRAFQGMNQTEVLNINILYLETIHALINQYIIANYRGEMESALNTLQLLATTMSPKIDTAKEEHMIDQIEMDLPRAITRDADGNIIRYSPAMFISLRRRLRACYKSILMKLESRGMLTFAPKDYKSVLGDFSKA